MSVFPILRRSGALSRSAPDRATVAARILKSLGTAIRVLAYASLLAVVSGVCILLTAGFWLAPPKEPPRAADVIVVLSGGLERSMYAADLYRLGVAPKLWVSRPAKEQSLSTLEQLGIVLPDEETLHKQILTRKGVPVQAISFFGEGSVSTVEEARALKKLAKSGMRMLVVTSPTHVLRARLMLSSALAGTGVDLQVLPTQYETFEWRWWENQESARSVVLEIAKLTYYFLGGRFFSRNNPMN